MATAPRSPTDFISHTLQQSAPGMDTTPSIQQQYNDENIGEDEDVEGEDVDVTDSNSDSGLITQLSHSKHFLRHNSEDKNVLQQTSTTMTNQPDSNQNPHKPTRSKRHNINKQNKLTNK